MKEGKIKIGFLLGAATNEGGTARVTSIIAGELAERSNYEIHIIGYVNSKAEGYGWNSKLKFHSLFQVRKPLKKQLIKGTVRLRRILKQEDIKILISCGAIYGPLGALSTLLSKRRHIYWDHSNFFQNSNHSFEMQGRKFSSKYSDRTVVLTKSDRENYLSFCKEEKVVQIYNPVDENLLANESDYNKNSKKIISVGRLAHAKNFEGLIDVAEIVFEKDASWEWHIFGKGLMEKELLQLIEKKGIQNNLKLKGHSSDLYNDYSKYGLLAMTSRYEGFPMSLLEGMGKKLPLISYDIMTGPNEIIEDGKNGYLIPFENKDEMASKILRLMADGELRAKMSSAQKEKIASFKIAGVITQWDQLISKTLS